MANSAYQQSGQAQDNLNAWQAIINKDAPQAPPFQNQTEIAMGRPLHEPVDANEDAGLAPYFGGVSAVIVVAFLVWRYFRKN